MCMSTTIFNNPIVNLLHLLPHQVADVKRKAIEAELTEVGMYQHYRQSVKRENWQMSDTRVLCAAILMKHLGLSLQFFSGTDQDREQEIERLVKQYYEEALS